MVTTRYKFIKILTKGRIFIRFIKRLTENERIQRCKVEIKGKLFLMKKAVRLRHINYFLSTGSLPVNAHSGQVPQWEAGMDHGLQVCHVGSKDSAAWAITCSLPGLHPQGAGGKERQPRTEPGLSAPWETGACSAPSERACQTPAPPT